MKRYVLDLCGHDFRLLFVIPRTLAQAAWSIIHRVEKGGGEGAEGSGDAQRVILLHARRSALTYYVANR
jgi:hypothetical protein